MKVQITLVLVAVVATALLAVATSGASGPAAAEGCGGIEAVEALLPEAESVGFDTRSAIEPVARPADPGQPQPCGRWATTYAGHRGVAAASRVVVDVFWSRREALAEWKLIGLRSVERYPDGARLAANEQYRLDAAGNVVARDSVVISVLGNVFVGSDGRWPPDVSPAVQDEIRIHRGIHAALHQASAGVARPNDHLLVLERRAGPYFYWYTPETRYGWDAWGNALSAFGLPTRLHERGTFCRVTWAHAGITVEFASSRRGPCLEEYLEASEWYGMSLYGGPWHNVHGVRIGDTVARVRKLYPRVRFDRARGQRRLVLLWARNEPRVVRLAVAINRAGRVTSIEVPPMWDASGSQ
jgi:hypothetical protein